ncbi:hypothetical protein ACSBL2_14605 [Pedobacter sp. AW31-3R]|uniref:hypothetical protein n=1 Tax=Pedobacter sp. AW31-3R TaxID=3445781 RepID=UPI003FA02316
MNELINFFYNQPLEIPLLIFLLVFSEGIALFHTIVFNHLYGWKARPKFLFFLLDPLLVLLAYLVRPGYALMAIALLFVSLFLLAVIGMIISSIRSGKEQKAGQERFNAKYPSAPQEKRKIVWLNLGMLAFIGFGWWLFSEGRLSLLLLIIPALILLDAIFLPTAKSKFYKLQAVLPTSKMNAVAMGLVEVTGDLVEISPILSPHFNTPCIGYAIRIEQRGKNNDGETTWSTIHSESKTGLFKIKDETGMVDVNGEGLEYYINRVDREAVSGDKRYSETYLKNDDYLLLIGKAISKNGETLIVKDEHQKVFGAAFPHEVAIKNKFGPLLKSFLSTLFFITLIIIYIIIS